MQQWELLLYCRSIVVRTSPIPIHTLSTYYELTTTDITPITYIQTSTIIRCPRSSSYGVSVHTSTCTQTAHSQTDTHNNSVDSERYHTVHTLQHHCSAVLVTITPRL